MKTTCATIALMVAFAAPTFAQDAKSIAEQGNQKWIEAYDSGNAPALTAIYSKDATLLPQGVAEPLVGEASIRKFFDVAVKPPRLLNMSIPVGEARMVSTDTLFDSGTWTANAPDKNGGATTRLSGTYLSVWHREGSSWRLIADTWNMMPPPSK